MKKCLVFMHEGVLKVCYPVQQPGQTEQEALEVASLPYIALAPRVVKVKDLPSGREFRRSWRLGEAGVEVDMEDAKALTMERIRAKRNAKLEATDREMLKLQETESDDAEAMKQARQALRDLPAILAPTVEACTTPDQLLNINLSGEKL